MYSFLLTKNKFFLKEQWEMDWEHNTTNKDDTSNSFPANRQIECITFPL